MNESIWFCVLLRPAEGVRVQIVKERQGGFCSPLNYLYIIPLSIAKVQLFWRNPVTIFYFKRRFCPLPTLDISLKTSGFSRLGGLQPPAGKGSGAGSNPATFTVAKEPTPHAQNLAVVAPATPLRPFAHPPPKKPPERPNRSLPTVK